MKGGKGPDRIDFGRGEREPGPSSQTIGDQPEHPKKEDEGPADYPPRCYPIGTPKLMKRLRARDEEGHTLW